MNTSIDGDLRKIHNGGNMKKHSRLKMIAAFALILCFGISPAWGADLYVDVTGAENGDGLGWQTAFTDLQDALAAAADGDTIHVAKGTYFPGNARDVYFIIKQSLTLLGGYPAAGGNRDPAVNQTILSGDIGAISDPSDNSYHVVSIWDPSAGVTPMAVTLDGFTITEGNASSENNNNTGGGMVVTGGFPVTLTNMDFNENEAVGGGGGLKFSGESLTLNNVNFVHNSTDGIGGGLLFTGGNLVMNHVNLSLNEAGDGGGVYFSGNGAMDMNYVNFFNNTAVGLSEQGRAKGGGMYISSSAWDFPLNLTNVTLSGNQANGNDSGMGGGIYVFRAPSYAAIALTNVTFAGNRVNGTTALGGGICLDLMNISNSWRNMVLTNVTFSGNQANGSVVGSGGGIFFFPSGDLNMFNVTMSGNIATGETSQGGGVFIGPSSNSFGFVRTFFRNSIFWGNAPDQLQNASAQWCIVEGVYPGYGNITEDPMLGTLGNYGGFTQTIPLLEGSSAIDTAEVYWSVDTDQRGELRPQGAGSDMGAYEVSVNLAGILINPSDPVPVNTEIHAEAGFTDALSGTHAYSAIWDWGDGNTSLGVIENGIVTGAHSYVEPGVYTVGLEVSEVNESSSLAGLLKTAVYQYAVVYDPAAGFVTGGGWFDSPEGAYKDDPSMKGQATFGFVSRYKKGAAVPTGNTAFEFAAGGLYFHSTSYDWLVVTGSDYAKFKGSGTINDWGDFKFMVWAGDGAPDTFRIKIWDEVEDTGEDVIYDNGSNQAIGGGSIVIHTK
jgi:hypothetical protein